MAAHDVSGMANGRPGVGRANGRAWLGRAGARAALAAAWLLAAATAAAPAAAVPQLNFREASGCGALIAYTWNDARTEVLVLRIDQSRATIKDGSTSLEIGPAGAAVTASLEVSETPRESFPYCDDDARTSERPPVWTAIAGRVKVIVKRRPGAPFTPVSVEIDRLVLQGPDGQQLRQRRDIQFTAAVSELR